MFNFRGIFRRSAAAGFVLLFWITLASAAAPTPDHVTLTWTQDPKTTQTISWRTDTATTGGQVRFGQDLNNTDPNSRSAISAALTSTLETTGGAVNIHFQTEEFRVNFIQTDTDADDFLAGSCRFCGVGFCRRFLVRRQATCQQRGGHHHDHCQNEPFLTHSVSPSFLVLVYHSGICRHNPFGNDTMRVSGSPYSG